MHPTYFCEVLLIKFTVYGVPEPQGSIRAFLPKGWTRPVLTSDNPHVKSWRQEVAKAAAGAVEHLIPRGTAVYVGIRFQFAPPKSWRNGQCYKPTRPDLDKLVRAVLDAMTGIVYEDDAQVAEVNAEKIFEYPEGCYIEVQAKA